MGLRGFLAPKRETSTETDTARYVAADRARTQDRVSKQQTAARRQASLDANAAADADWDSLIRERRSICPLRNHDGCIGH